LYVCGEEGDSLVIFNFINILKKIIVSVSNDLYSDQRVRKVCASLLNMGFEIQLLGRKLQNSKIITDRGYKIKRFSLWFTKGPLFYANLNIRLFFFLLFNKADVLLANDLDTLAANYIVSKIKKIPLVYDTHEYFTEVPELQGRYSKKVWEKIENDIFPKLENVFTVNSSIANIYSTKYNVVVNVIKNLPNRNKINNLRTKEELGLDKNQKYIILQGAGINIDRGAEELIIAMKYIDKAKLLIVGSGDVLPILKDMVISEKLENKVVFIPKQSPEVLKSYTAISELGISIDKNTNLNYKYSLPNKIFDYIQGGIPILASDLPEIKKVVNTYQIGLIIQNHKPDEISEKINFMLNHDFKQQRKDKILKASEELTWESQENTLKKVYSKFL
jgi:glycosyltransferase involved in cell wall biosynthesis